MATICPGCGKPVPANSRGQRAQYCGARCRQRARRARLNASGDRAALLDTVHHAERALATLRRALLHGGRDVDVAPAAAELTTLTAALHAGVAPSTPSPAAPTPGVTQRVTAKEAPTRPDRDALTPTGAIDHEPALTLRPAAEPVTTQQAAPVGRDDPASTPQVTKRVTRKKKPVIDTGTLRIERAEDYSTSGYWQVIADAPDGTPVPLGTLRPVTQLGSRRRKWQAYTAHRTQAPGGPWSTREDALYGLYQLLTREDYPDGIRKARKPRHTGT